jgi:polyisoprenoid-binding protein YceI
MKIPILILGLTILATSIASAQQIDTQKSVISFDIGNLRINTVSGTFKGMSGTVEFDPANLSNSNFNVCIDVSTVQTGNNKRDQHLKESDFFDLKNHPQICYQSGEISKTETGYETTGKLTIKGITRIVTIPFTYQENLLKGSFTVNRLDYNVGENTGTFMVSNPAEVTIKAVLKE